MTGRAGKTGGGGDLARPPTSAAVENGYQRPHALDDGRQKLMELRRSYQ